MNFRKDYNDMTLKEELEILRDESIEVFNGDPMDIPCIETSDAEKLCRRPVVSVMMATYNHEPYIRRAIEGVMMQQTDFEFELVIGEDCSQDRTREICLEYQKKHPDKIRVLWWHENVSKLGGNSRRILARCRGDYLAFCEGDDYWIDPLKLQKQVDLMRRTGAVFGVASSEWHYPDGRVRVDIYDDARTELSLQDFFKHYFHTTTYLVDRKAYLECRRQHPEILYWYDCTLAWLMAATGRVCHLPDVVSVYNWTYLGVSGRPGNPKNVMMLTTQYLQFAHCSIPEIAAIGMKKAIEFLIRGIAFGIFDRNYSFDGKIRFRALCMAGRLIRQHYGVFALLKFMMQLPRRAVKARILIFYLNHPTLMALWRRCKKAVVALRCGRL